MSSKQHRIYDNQEERVVDNQGKLKDIEEGHVVIETLEFQCLYFGKIISEKLVPTDNYAVGEKEVRFPLPF